MRILFIGDASPDRLTRYRANALVRLGHQVTIADIDAAFARETQHPAFGRLHYRSGYRLLQGRVRRWIRRLVQQNIADPPDVVWVDHGQLIGRQAAELLRQLNVPMLVHNVDDPTGGRDGHRFDSLLEALPVYDLCVVVRSENVDEFLRAGAKAVHRTWMSYDEIKHAPFDDASRIEDRFQSDVAFAGTWIRGEERDRFLLTLAERGLKIAIWGNRWDKAPLWKQLRPWWRGPALAGRDYVAAICGAKVSLGLLSHGNRDLHTARSMEIPYAGGLLCAERTSEHREAYREGEEAVFWENARECADACETLLADDDLRNRIRMNGAKRVRQTGYGNERVCREILESLAKHRQRR